MNSIINKHKVATNAQSIKLSLDKVTSVVTHGGVFHADEVFAISLLAYAKNGFKKPTVDLNSKQIEVVCGSSKFTVIRNRDFAKGFATWAIDTGGFYDPSDNKFDHHQTTMTEMWDGGNPMSACGLIYTHYVYLMMISHGFSIDDVSNLRMLCQKIDARDNGIMGPKGEYGPTTAISSFLPVWTPERDHTNEDMNVTFRLALDWAIRFLESYFSTFPAKDHLFCMCGEIINNEKAKVLSDVITEEIIQKKIDNLHKGGSSTSVLMLEKFIPWSKTLAIKNSPKTLKFVVFPSLNKGEFVCQTISDWDRTKNPQVLVSRCPFPEEWNGKTNGELEEASGIKGAKFCHKNGFMFVADNVEGAIQAAALATHVAFHID